MAAIQRGIQRLRTRKPPCTSLLRRTSKLRFLIFALALTAAYAGDMSKLSGHVSDQSGAAIPDAGVAIAGRDTDLKVNLTTDVNGRFSTAPLPRGAYVISVSSSGFEPQQRVVTLSTGDGTIDVIMPLAK